MRRITQLTAAVVFVDTLFFAALIPLLPHYSHTLGLGKAGAGLLAASYPLGTFLGAIPSGFVAARFGVKRTVLVGLLGVATTTAAFGLLETTWQLDLARFLQGLASSFSWTGALAWLVAAAPEGKKGELIGKAFAAAVGGALFGPVLGSAATRVGTGWAFGSVALASLILLVWAARTPAARAAEPQPIGALLAALRDRWILFAVWLVTLPALLFGAMDVLAPLRMSALGLGGIGIGAVFLLAGLLETGNNLVIGKVADRRGPLLLVRGTLVLSTAVLLVLPWPRDRYLLGAVVILGTLAFGTFYTPGMSLLTTAAEARGLDYGYAFALLNLAWAPGQTLGASVSGGLGQAVGDWAPYSILAALASITLVALMRSGAEAMRPPP